MINSKLKVGIYCRTGNNDTLTIKQQEEKLKDFCKNNDYEVFKIYSDNGFSAIDENRPSYNLMLEDLRRKKFDMIITFNLERIHRSILNLEEFIRMLKENNCKFKSINESIDLNSPSGIFLAKVLTIFKENERKLITNE